MDIDNLTDKENTRNDTRSKKFEYTFELQNQSTNDLVIHPEIG